MAYPIRMIEGAPEFKTLPLFKITHYPQEPREYRPFAQARLCCSETAFFVRMWAFEVLVLPESRLAARLDFSGRGERYIDLWMDGVKGHAATLRDGQGNLIRPLEGVSFSDFCGEDLQGIYWGGTAQLPLPLIEEFFPMTKLQKGAILKGNLLKLCENSEQPHFGCLFPAASPEEALLAGSFGEFTLVGY